MSDKSVPPTTLQVQGISFAASLRGASESNILQGIPYKS